MEMIETHGVAIPRLRLGTFRMPGDAARPVVESGLVLGFRHIDTAAMYDNEAAVGGARGLRHQPLGPLNHYQGQAR